MMNPETPIFVMPHFGDDPDYGRYLRRAVAGLIAQTDPGWRLVIVDDASPQPDALATVHELQRTYPDRISVVEQAVNQGQGVCRNIGVSWAVRHGAPFVLFHDADDVSNPRRLEVTGRLFRSRPEVGFVYSTFQVIDENDNPVPLERLTPSIAEILRSHDAPVEGPDAWIRIGAESGYTTLTSTVSVRTEVALAHPFPPVRGSEDAHTWLRMSAGGAHFAYLEGIPGKYRVPQQAAGSSDRARIGADYYLRKAIVDTDGFRQAVRLALSYGTLDASRAARIEERFLRRLATTMLAEGLDALADDILAGRTPHLNVITENPAITAVNR
jgi:glycosyltransferase involved in cell wall biosynthesis